MQQPRALLLADTLDAGFECDLEWYEIEAAKELRRLHAELTETTKANEWLQTVNARVASEREVLLEALRYAIKQVPELITVPGVRAAISKAEGDTYASR